MAYRDVAGRSRPGVFDKITLPSGDTIVPVSGNGRRVTFRDSNGLTFDAPNTANPSTLEYYRDQAALPTEPLRY